MEPFVGIYKERKSSRATAHFLASVFLLVGVNFPATAQDSVVQSQEEIQQRIAEQDPGVFEFVKDRPILGWLISSGNFEDIPEAIRTNLGGIDQTKYSEEYLVENIGSIVALQMSSEKPDFYIIGKVVFDEKYEIVDVQNVVDKNSKLISRLENVPDVLAMLTERNASIVGALKSVPVEMIKFSDIGYGTSETVTINSPWGEQTKPSDQEGFLVWDSSENQYYMVNEGDDGNPLGYVPF